MKKIKVSEWVIRKEQQNASHYNTFIDFERNEDGMAEIVDGKMTVVVIEELGETEKAIKVRLASGDVVGSVKGWTMWIPKSQIEEVVEVVEEIKEEEKMEEITIYVARVSDDNSDAVKAFATKEEAVNYAEYLAAHLTDREKKTHTVSVETFTFEAPEGMTAEDAYSWGLDEDVVPCSPEDYIEVE